MVLKKTIKAVNPTIEKSSVAHLLFGFEADLIETLCCIPMIVRLKLDVCGIKLTLRAWNQLDRSTREELMCLSTSTPKDIAKYRAKLDEAMKRSDETLIHMNIDLTPYWTYQESVPDPVVKKGQELGINLVDHPQWKKLNTLQRFALIKLTRAQHENMNFMPALKEFGMTN